MTPEALAAIKARCESATPGPWDVDAGPDWVCVDTLCVADPEIALVVCRARVIDEEPARAKADASFIASARSDVPLLVAEVERLTVELDAATKRAEIAEARAEYWRAKSDTYDCWESYRSYSRRNAQNVCSYQQAMEAEARIGTARERLRDLGVDP